MIDLAAIKARAAGRMHRQRAATPANAASRLIQDEPASQLAGLAGVADASDPYAQRRDRLLRWGWAPAEAERVARRLSTMAAEDSRRACVDCTNYRPHQCRDHRHAGLQGADVSRHLAALPQRCTAHEPMEGEA